MNIESCWDHENLILPEIFKILMPFDFRKIWNLSFRSILSQMSKKKKINQMSSWHVNPMRVRMLCILFTAIYLCDAEAYRVENKIMSCDQESLNKNKESLQIVS